MSNINHNQIITRNQPSTETTWASSKQEMIRANKEDLDRITTDLSVHRLQPRRKIAVDRAFSLSEKAQSNCRLFTLPEEIQLNIFERLLKNDEPLRKGIQHTDMSRPLATNTSPPSAILTNFDLDPQVLVSCQYIYKKFSEIFYLQNSIEITVMRDTRHYHPVMMIMGEVYAPEENGRYDLKDRNQSSVPASIRAFKKFHISLESRDLNRYVGPPSAIPMYELIPSFSRALIVMLYNKEVTLHLKNLPHWDIDLILQLFRMWSNPLKILRCQQFSIISNKMNIDLHILFRSIERIVMSREPPVDLDMLYEASEAFLKQIQTRFLPIAGSREGKPFRDEMRKLKAAVEAWRYDDFVETRRGLMEVARSKMRALEVLEVEAEECMPEYQP